MAGRAGSVKKGGCVVVAGASMISLVAMSLLLSSTASIAHTSRAESKPRVRRTALELGGRPAKENAKELSRRREIVLSYDATWGLSNQLFSHITALAVASALNATLVPSDAYSRSSFAGEPHFQPEPLGTLLDVDKLAKYWGERGLRLSKSVDVSSCAVVDLLSCIGQKHWGEYSMDKVLEVVRSCIAQGAPPLRHTTKSSKAHCVHLLYGNPFETLLPHFPSSLAHITPAARGIFFAPRVLQVADAVLEAMAAKGHTPFLGLHLRIEGDWRAGGPPDARNFSTDLFQMYVDCMRAAGFNSDSAVYVASGVFSYQSKKENAQLETRFRQSGVMGTMLNKEVLLPASALEGLHSEQLALVDLLVLSRCVAFVGDPRSTLSAYVRDLRALKGVPKRTFYPVTHAEWGFYAFTPPDREEGELEREAGQAGQQGVVAEE